MAIEKRLRCSSTTPAARNPEDGESERARQESDVRAPTRISGGSRSKEPALAENVHRERLIQSKTPRIGLADVVLNVIRRSAALGFRVSQVPIRKRVRCPSEKPDESGAHSGTVHASFSQTRERRGRRSASSVADSRRVCSRREGPASRSHSFPRGVESMTAAP